MNPIKKYEQDIKEHGFQRDPAQEQAVKSLDELFHQFQDYMNTPIPQLTRFQKLMGKKTKIPLTCSICFMTTYLIRLQKMIGGIEYHFYYQVHIQ